MFLHTCEQQKALPIGLQCGEHDWHLQTVTSSAKCQGACSEVWDVLVLNIALPPYRFLLLSKINQHVLLAPCCCGFQSDSLFFHLPRRSPERPTSVSQHCLLFPQPKGGSGGVKAASSKVTKPIPRGRKGQGFPVKCPPAQH